MLKYYIGTTEALKRMRTDNDGVVSFEYVVVGAVVVGAVVAAFGPTSANGISGTLTTALGAISDAVTGATTPTP